ncbi:MAG: hypothetical protein QF464_17965 [Myxococcota bacterium]|jgi:hypothetical protein|nr:hypothetical protein [Myxococcota bacterium]
MRRPVAMPLLLALTVAATVPEPMHDWRYLTNTDGEAVHCPDALR